MRWLLWLVCAFLLAAAVDRLPDPPAVARQCTKICGIAPDHQTVRPERVILPQWSFTAFVDAAPLIEHEYPGVPPIYIAELAHQATDTSPPV
jgi:hypothetical protein